MSDFASIDTSGAVLHQEEKKTISWLTLYYLIIAEGAISIALEILAIRQVVPYVGANVVVTSTIISGFLLSLALGYSKGGKVKSRYIPSLTKNIVLTQVLLVFGLSTPFLAVLQVVTVDDHVFLLLFLTLVICPATFMVGQTVPILSNYFKSETHGELSGKILFLSTVGSCTGSFFTAAVLMNYVGVNHTIGVVSGLATTVVVALVYNSSGLASRYWLLTSVFLTIMSFSVINNSSLTPTSPAMKQIFSMIGVSSIYQNSYSTVSIYENNDTRYMNVNNSLSSSYNLKTGRSSFNYVNHMEARIAQLGDDLEILVIGAGGFTIGVVDQSNSYLYIDVDPMLKDVSEKHFLEHKINGVFIAKDARSYLNNANRIFDVIVGDAYTNSASIPPALVSAEYFQSVANALKPSGVALFNVSLRVERESAFAQHITDTIHSVFNCLSVDVSPQSTHGLTNIVFECRPRSFAHSVYTDNQTNLFELAR